MKEWTLEEVSDGRLYRASDMARVGCGDCTGCSACCRNMGRSVILAPLDMPSLMQAGGMDFQTLKRTALEIHVVEGMILPNLRMVEDGSGGHCYFLDENGRCSIHPHRPAVCRLFPLGRVYGKEKRELHYFLLTNGCQKKNLSKVKIEKWLDMPDIRKEEAYHIRWHYFLAAAGKHARTMTVHAQEKFCEDVLKTMYEDLYYGNEDLYKQFEERISGLEEKYGIES